MKYSVLLLYPDYMSDAYGQETYYAHVEAGTPRQAAEKAKLQAIQNVNEDELYIDLSQAQDFFCLSVIEGHRQIKYDDFNQYPEDPPPPVAEVTQYSARQPVSFITATIKLAYQVIKGETLAEVLTYRPDLKNATSKIVSISDGKKRHIRQVHYGLNNIDPCAFLDLLGHENRQGRLIDVKMY